MRILPCVVVLGAAVLTTQAAIAGNSTALQKARALEARAVKQNCAWTITEDALDAADAAAKKGDHASADKLAARAARLAQLSLDQAKQQRGAWKRMVVQ